MAKKAIAILGGGIAALTAAFELSKDSDYEITVYQMGWRLGGKCSTARNQNPKMGCRIQEHGIHFLLGFYENTFRVIRQVYDHYLKKHKSPFTSWSHPFRRQDTVTAMVNDNGRWFPFGVKWPRSVGLLPGDESLSLHPAQPPSVWQLNTALLDWLSLTVGQIKVNGEFGMGLGPEGLTLVRLEGLYSEAHEIAAKHPKEPPDSTSPDLKAIITKLDESADLLHGSPFSDLGDQAKQYLILLEIGTAIAKGVIKDDLLHGGFDSVDHREFTDWLEDHGCKHTDAAVIRAGYDACFAYRDGDPSKPTMSAAVALHGAFRLWFTYKGSIFWPMKAGMAEVIFVPLYHVLCDRGVKFRFFHRVRHLGLSHNGKSVDTIALDVQATLKDSSKEYNPFITVKGLECWPDTPRYDQLNDNTPREGDMESAWAAPDPVGSKTLKRGEDFDEVILGISLGAVPHICADLVKHSAAWRKMVEAVPTVQTQALQLWLTATAAQLGFHCGTIVANDDPACVSAFVKPFDTYGDLSDLRERECWPMEDNVQHLAYFCSTMEDAADIPPPGHHPGFLERERARVRSSALEFLRKDVKNLWPKCTLGSNGFNWQLLVDKAQGTGEERLDAQYIGANIDPSARYVISPPNAIRARLYPDCSGFEHLFLAGDWTRTPMNSGCVEAATMSGLRAAQGVSKTSVFIYGWS